MKVVLAQEELRERSASGQGWPQAALVSCVPLGRCRLSDLASVVSKCYTSAELIRIIHPYEGVLLISCLVFIFLWFGFGV